MKNYEIARLFERLIGERAPYALDLDGVLRTAKRHGKALEINADPERLDLNDVNARRAREIGVLLAIDTDAHMLDHLDCMELGVAPARRAWIGKGEVVNTRPLDRLQAWARPSTRGRPGHKRR